MPKILVESIKHFDDSTSKSEYFLWNHSFSALMPPLKFVFFYIQKANLFNFIVPEPFLVESIFLNLRIQFQAFLFSKKMKIILKIDALKSISHLHIIAK